MLVIHTLEINEWLKHKGKGEAVIFTFHSFDSSGNL